PVRPVRPDTTLRRTPAESAQARALDTATARRLGLPTGPSRSFPPSDPVIDSLLKLKGFRVTKYMADTLVVQGGDTQITHLRGEALVEREGTKLESDSIRYRQRTCRLDAVGDPRLFDQATVMVGEGMKYDTCVKRGTVSKALTAFQQGSARWYVRGDLAVDSGSTRLYGATSEVTADDYWQFPAAADWYAGRYFPSPPRTRYRWLDRFIDGGLSFERYAQLDASSSSIRLGWQHQQSFSSRTRFNANIDYASNTSVIQ